jgi:hypothetical protein
VALIGFVAVIAFCAAMLLIDNSRDPIDQEREPATSLARAFDAFVRVSDRG